MNEQETHFCGDPSECHYDEGYEKGKAEELKRVGEVIIIMKPYVRKIRGKYIEFLNKKELKKELGIKQKQEVEK